MSTKEQIERMLKNGITATCDVSAPYSLITTSKQLTIVPSAGMTMDDILSIDGDVFATLE